jgi:HTH-type transcriptional repressor of NAD biosynthesis genes
MEKKFKNGLVLGKFYGLHKGHLHLIDSAFEQSENVHVLMCSLKSETISGVDRFHWLTEIYKDNPNVNIIHITDENPQYPEEHPDFWEIWYNTVYNNVEELDVVFTSEDYGVPFSKVLKIEHVLVDKDRLTVPISGTMVRSNPLSQWEFIPKISRGYFQKKIVIIGAESTGKSTMVENLAEYYNCKMIEEYGRTYTEPIGDLYELTVKDMENIATEHYDQVHRHDSDPTKFLFVDTEAITTKVFGQIYIDENFHSDVIEDVIKKQDYDFYFLLENDVPYINDGKRLPEDFRSVSNKKLKEELEKYNINYVSVSGNYEERFEKIKNHIKI